MPQTASYTQALLDSGANPEATDNAGWTPLIYAAYGGHLEVTEIILDQVLPPLLFWRYGVHIITPSVVDRASKKTKLTIRA